MRDVQAQVVGIETNTTNTGKTRYDIKLSNGEQVTAWELALATKASQTGGQVVTVRIEDKPGRNPGVVYHNLKELALPGELLAPIVAQPGTPIGLPPATPGVTGAAIPITQGAPATSGGGGGGMTAEDKARVTKLSCISSACELLAGSGDVEAALEAAQTIYAAVMPQPVAAPAAAPAPVGLPDPAAAMAAAQDAAGIAAAAAAAGTPIQLGTAGVQPAAAPAALPWATS